MPAIELAHPTNFAARAQRGLREEKATEAQILVVDDDPDFLDLLAQELGRIPGVNITVAHSPAEAVSWLARQDFELIVSDWALDSSTADEVFTEADELKPSKKRESPTKIPVMFMSGSEKVGPTQRLTTLKHFEPVTFTLKRCGPSLISRLAEHILNRFTTFGRLQPCSVQS